MGGTSENVSKETSGECADAWDGLWESSVSVGFVDGALGVLVVVFTAVALGVSLVVFATEALGVSVVAFTAGVLVCPALFRFC